MAVKYSEYLFGVRNYRVIGTAAVVRLNNGSEVTLYKHNPLPGNAAPGHVAQLIELGLVEEVMA